MSIYTRRGDQGETSLPDRSRVIKSDPRIEAYGCIDEALAVVGVASAAATDPLLYDVVAFAQQRLFNCGSAIAMPESDSPLTRVTAEDVKTLEIAIDRFEAVSGPQAGFIVEGGTDAAARLFFASSVLRRAERRVVALLGQQPIDPNVLAFLNRCSDMLFAAGRYANAVEDVTEIMRDPDYPRPEL